MCDKFSRSEEYRSNIQSMCPKKFRYWGRVGMSFWNSLRRSVTVDFIGTLLRERAEFLASRHHPESCILVMKKHWRWTKLPSSAHFDLEKNHYVHVIIDRNTSSSATSATPDTSHNPILPHLLLFLIRSWASSFFLKNGYFDTDEIDGTIKKVIKKRNLLNKAWFLGYLKFLQIFCKLTRLIMGKLKVECFDSFRQPARDVG